MVLGAVENRNAGATNGGEQALRRLDRAMCIDAAAIGILRIKIDGSSRPAAINKVVEINGQECNRRSNKRLACIRRVELDVGCRHDVFPAMIFELFFRRHDCLRSWSHIRRTRAAISTYPARPQAQKSMLCDASGRTSLPQ